MAAQNVGNVEGKKGHSDDIYPLETSTMCVSKDIERFKKEVNEEGHNSFTKGLKYANRMRHCSSSYADHTLVLT